MEVSRRVLRREFCRGREKETTSTQQSISCSTQRGRPRRQTDLESTDSGRPFLRLERFPTPLLTLSTSSEEGPTSSSPIRKGCCFLPCRSNSLPREVAAASRAGSSATDPISIRPRLCLAKSPPANKLRVGGTSELARGRRWGRRQGRGGDPLRRTRRRGSRRRFLAV